MKQMCDKVVKNKVFSILRLPPFLGPKYLDVLTDYRISYDGLDPRVVPHVTMGFKGVRTWQKSWPG